MKTLRKYWRRFLARWFPMQFAKWLNCERSSIEIKNDPDGKWTVQIGIVPEGYWHTLGGAMHMALRNCEDYPEFQFPSDFLRSLK